MIDLHCHILPGVDDGAHSLTESCEMARVAAADGIRKIVATPHTCNGIHRNIRADIIRGVEELNEAISQCAIPLEVIPGAEVELTSGLSSKLRQGEACTINDSRYVLLEFPEVFELDKIKDEVFGLRMNGFIPILAHPERHTKFQLEFDCLREFIELGALCQITGASLTGGFGRSVKFAAEKMVLFGLAHIIASDSHASNWREPVLSAALNKAAKLLGSEPQARRLIVDNPQSVIADRDMAFDIPGTDNLRCCDNKRKQPGKFLFQRLFN